MISKKSVGRSSTGLVKIWSKYPLLVAIDQDAELGELFQVFLDGADAAVSIS